MGECRPRTLTNEQMAYSPRGTLLHRQPLAAPSPRQKTGSAPGQVHGKLKVAHPIPLSVQFLKFSFRFFVKFLPSIRLASLPVTMLGNPGVAADLLEFK